MTARLDLEYDGGAFAGWARQPGRRTVQRVLEEALAATGRPVALSVAGR
ncbi:MAG: tRNA pseudouridine(38-40) synthase TruA, partial [Actinomycetota bacterium]|nr:tRNA pseudouridine(38-40) synthase TruA [Actinomycetota bacterium]